MHTDVKPSTIRWIVGLGSLGLAIFFALLGGVALNERETLWHLQLSKQHELQRLALRSAQLNLENQAQLLTQTLAADAWLVDLLRQAAPLERDATPSAQALQAIRAQLFTRLAPRWRTLQPHYPFDLNLYLSNSEVSLRLQQPEHFGDRPQAPRSMLLDALQDANSRTGLVGQ